MGRLTDNDKHFGPITYGRSHGWRPWRLVWSSEGADEGDYRESAPNSLTVYAFGWVAKVNMPRLVRPLLIKHVPTSWTAETIARLGRDYYYEAHPREYGFCLSDGHLSLYLGAQTHDSLTTQSWGCFLPWTQWRFHRFSLYDTRGSEFWTQFERDRKRGAGRRLCEYWDAQHAAEKACPSVSFDFTDYDGSRITAKTRIEEREWHFGQGYFRWLSWFRKPKIRRSLDLEFSEEVGPEKGSWKGGTMGHGIDMLPGELHEAAFRRYCNQQQRSKYQPYQLTFIGIKA